MYKIYTPGATQRFTMSPTLYGLFRHCLGFSLGGFHSGFWGLFILPRFSWDEKKSFKAQFPICFPYVSPFFRIFPTFFRRRKKDPSGSLALWCRSLPQAAATAMASMSLEDLMVTWRWTNPGDLGLGWSRVVPHRSYDGNTPVNNEKRWRGCRWCFFTFH